MVALLGFIQNIEQMTNSTFLLPPLLLAPVFLTPNNDFNHSKDDKDIDYNFKDDIDNFIDGNNQDDIDNYRQSLNRGSNYKHPMIGNQIDMFRQSMTSSNTSSNENSTQLSMNKIINSTMLNNSSVGRNDTEIMNITTENSLPSVEDHWQNFTVNTNFSTKNESQFSTMNELTTDSNLLDKGPYSAALYDNAFIDQLSITTNSYTNEQSPLPSPENDRWRTILPIKTPFLGNGFQPLAGLYYDGFLHKPLFMVPGFIPRKNYIFRQK